MGQGIFLLVFVVLAAAATAWGADDLRQRGELSELSHLSLSLLGVLGLLVLVLVTADGTWPIGAPLLPRVLLAGALVAGAVALATCHSGAQERPGLLPGAERFDPLVLVAFAAAILGGGGVALLLLVLATVGARVLLAARVAGAGSARSRAHRWAPTPAVDGPTEGE